MFKIRSSLFFFFILAGLVLYIYFFETKQKTTDQLEQVRNKLFEVDGGAINELEVTNGEATVVLVKKDGKWTILKPVATSADSGTVEAMLSELEFAEARRVIPYKQLESGKEKETIRQWGLEAPSLRVRFSSPTSSQELAIGRKTAVSGTFYARASSEAEAPIYLISGNTRTALDKKLDDLRAREVFNLVTSEVTRLGLRQAAAEGQPLREVEVAKTGDAWSLQKPLVARADRGKINSWMANLVSLRAVKFVSEDNSNLNEYGLSTPATQIWVQAGPKADENTLLIGKPVPTAPQEVYAKRLRNNTVFTLQENLVRSLAANLPDARDRRILEFDPNAITEVRVDNKGKVAGAMKKEAGGWELIAPSSGRANEDGIRNFLGKLSELEAVAFVRDTSSELKLFGLDKPVLRVVLGKGKGGEKVELSLGKTDKKQVFALSSQDPFVYAVDASFVDLVPKDSLALRALDVIEADPKKVRKLAIVAAKVRTVFSRDAAGTWTVDPAPPDMTADGAKIDAQASLLCGLRAVRWLGPVLPIYGLKEPIYRMELTLEGSTVAVRIGQPLATGGRAAQVEGNDAAFELRDADFKILDQVPLERSAPKVTPVASPVPATIPATSPH